MAFFKDFDFNEFEVVEHKKLPKLATTRGVNISDWGFSGGISPVWEDGFEGLPLFHTDDESMMDEFDEWVTEFNNDTTQEEWNVFYDKAKKYMVDYYKRQIEKNTDELTKLLADN